jgi:hypothetical protein
LWALTSSEDDVTLVFVGLRPSGQARFQFTNRSGRTITWLQEAGVSCPWYRIRRRGRLVWDERCTGICGTGARRVVLPPGQSLVFDTPLDPYASGTVQVGVPYRDGDRGADFTVWTSPFDFPSFPPEGPDVAPAKPAP